MEKTAKKLNQIFQIFGYAGRNKIAYSSSAPSSSSSKKG
jgi:hypothetical protein